MSQPVRDLRDPGYPSARSLLLTVLGEFVHARGGRVWTGTLVDALGALGVEQKSARQALARAAAAVGLLLLAIALVYYGSYYRHGIGFRGCAGS